MTHDYKQKRPLCICSGYFAPLHDGHIQYFQKAWTYCWKTYKMDPDLIVIINNDEQTKLKGSIPFAPARVRSKIVDALLCVSHTIVSHDKDLSVSATLAWLYDATKYQVSELPPHIRTFLIDHMKKHNFSLKWVAIIHDNNPNAFTYGHTKKRARIAITEGILNYLDEDEQLAVVAHECGHIIHRDFIWMTMAAAVPLICYCSVIIQTDN